MIDHMLVHKIRLDLKELKQYQECSLITVKSNYKSTTQEKLGNPHMRGNYISILKFMLKHFNSLKYIISFNHHNHSLKYISLHHQFYKFESAH